MAYLLYGATSFVWGQTGGGKVVEGLVVDSLGMALKGVNVRLTNDHDTVYTISNDLGKYRFQVADPAGMELYFTMLGRRSILRSVPGHSLGTHIRIPTVKMLSLPNLISEVHILKVIPIVQRGDTIVFNLGGFNYSKNSLLEDVLKNNLPGFQVMRSGATYYNGQRITSVQVDGRKFFGGDLLTATRNLPADIIKQLEVIDHYGDMSEVKGIKNSEPEKIINIILHEDKKKIFFGQGTVGGGTSDRFLGSVGANQFDSGREFSVVASLNNTNTSLFAFGSPDGASGRSGALSEIGDYADQADGLNKITAFGVSFSDDIGKNISITGGYQFNRRENLTIGNSLLTSTYQTYRISKRDSFATTTDDDTHKFNLELNTRFKNKDLLRISPMLTFNRFQRYNKRENVLRNFRLTNEGEYRDSSVTNNPNGQVNVLFSKYFAKPNRKLVAEADVSLNRSRKYEDVKESYVILDSTGAQPIRSDFDQQQFVRQTNKTNSTKASFSYVEPFFTHSLLEISHEFELTDIDAFRQVRSPMAGGDEMAIIDSLGLRYNYTFVNNRVGLNYQYGPNDRFRVNMGFAVQPSRLEGRVANDTLTHRYHHVNLVPSAKIRYRFNDELDWQFTYQGRNNQPNFLHIAPVRDNSNSRHVIVGNPLLKAEFINRLSTTLRKSIISKSQYFELNLAYNFTNNKIVTARTAASNETIQQTTFTNTNGYYEVKGYYVFNTPFPNDRFLLDLTGSLDYFNNIVFVNQSRSLTSQYLFSQNVQLRYNWDDYFESVFNTKYLMNHAVYRMPREDKVSAHSVLFSLGGRGYLNQRLMAGFEMSQKIFRGYAVEITDVSPTIINTYIEYSFLKNRMAMLRLECYDILDQNRNVGVSTEYIGNDIFESRNNRLGRYFMLSLNVRLQKLPKKSR